MWEADQGVFSCSLGSTHPCHFVFTRTELKDYFIINMVFIGKMGMSANLLFLKKATGKEELVN